MIVKMKKVSVIVLDLFRVEALEKLAEAGVLHVENEPGKSDALSQLVEKRDLIQRAMVQLPVPEDEVGEKPKAGDTATALELSKHVLKRVEDFRDLRERMEKAEREQERLRPWGEFDPKDIDYLRRHGVEVSLYEIPLRSFQEHDGSGSIFVVNRTKTTVYAMVVEMCRDQIPEDWHELQLPEKGLQEIISEITALETSRNEIRVEFEKLARETVSLEAAIREIGSKIEFEAVRSGCGLDGPLAYLTGYVPEGTVDRVTALAQEHGWGVLVREPESTDRVPTLVRNPKSIRIIQPVFDLLGTVPGYHENDISLPFLVFFGFFFAMIIGDAGYGVVLLIGSLIGVLKSRKSGTSPTLILMLVLSLCTLVWGALTGTWFGSEAIGESAPFKYLVVDGIGSFREGSSETVKLLCFIIGTIQLSIAHIWNFLKEIRNTPKIRAFAQLGWLSAVLGLFYLVLNLVLDPVAYPIPAYAMYMMGIGIGAVIVFSNQEGNFFKGVAKGFAGFITTFLDGISAFSDIISYIRLFAVGLASVEIAKSFNAMAGNLGDGVVAIVGGILILVFGHTLNLAMGALSVIVHGVRLNMLEFSSHLGMEWTGIHFRPFGRTNS